MRVGLGYDVHRLVNDRRLVLGGVCIPYDKGLLGHSDADVLCHAVIDALLGAAKKGDIGEIFPDTDAEYKDISSILLLERTGLILYDCYYRVINIDCVICAQAPKIAPYREQMEKNIAFALKIQPDSVSVKATTEEGLGFTGTGEGIAARTVCLIEKFDINNKKRFLKA